METFQQPLNHGRSCLPRRDVALAGRVEPWASVMSRCRKEPGHVLPGALGPLIICRVLARRVSGGLPEEWGHLKTERDCCRRISMPVVCTRSSNQHQDLHGDWDSRSCALGEHRISVS